MVRRKEQDIGILKNYPNDVDKLIEFLQHLKKRISVLSYNIVTQSAERIKLYTNLYTVIFIYLKQLGVLQQDIKLEVIAETLLTNSGIMRRAGDSIGTLLAASIGFRNTARHEKYMSKAEVDIKTGTGKDAQTRTVGRAKGGKSKRNKKNNKKSKTKRRR